VKCYTDEFCALAEYPFRLSIRDTNTFLPFWLSWRFMNFPIFPSWFYWRLMDLPVFLARFNMQPFSLVILMNQEQFLFFCFGT